MFIRYFDSIPTARTIFDHVLIVRERTLDVRLQFKLSLTRQPFDLHFVCSNIVRDTVRLNCAQLAHTSTARSVRTGAYDIGEPLMHRMLLNQSLLLETFENHHTHSTTTLHALTSPAQQPCTHSVTIDFPATLHSPTTLAHVVRSHVRLCARSLTCLSVRMLAYVFAHTPPSLLALFSHDQGCHNIYISAKISPDTTPSLYRHLALFPLC
jgi:hypothetical protein